MIKINRYFYILVAVPIAVLFVCLLAVSIIISSSKKSIYEDIGAIPESEAALILGAAVLQNGGLSPVLRDRVDKAIELYEAKKVKTIIASGNSQGLDFNEVEPIQQYLLDRGVPAGDILVDNAGVDTYSSIYRAQHTFNKSSLTIVTQSFHLPRSIFVADKLGLTAYGLSADRGHYKLINYFREMLADIKAVLNLIVHRTPITLETEAAGDSEQCCNSGGGYVIPLW